MGQARNGAALNKSLGAYGGAVLRKVEGSYHGNVEQTPRLHF